MALPHRCALVTGAARGLGAGLVQGLLERGLQRVYAADCEAGPASTDPRIVRLNCDITRQVDVDRLAAACPDIDLLVNNAGVNACQGLLDAPSLDAAARELEVNLLGTLRVTRAFVPVLERQAPAAIVGIASALGFAPIAALGSYCVSKAALAKALELLRAELAPRRIHVMTALPGAIDTPLIAALSFPKSSVAEAVDSILDGLARGEAELLVGDEARDLAQRYRADAAALLRELAAAAPPRRAAGDTRIS